MWFIFSCQSGSDNSNDKLETFTPVLLWIMHAVTILMISKKRLIFYDKSCIY